MQDAEPATPPATDNVSAFWATPEALRQSFVRGKHIGRGIVTATALSIIAAPIVFASLPVWGVSLLGGIAASVALANGIGYAMDRDNHCQLELGKTALEKPQLKTAKDFFRQGLKNGIAKTLKKLPLAVIGTVFWPALLVAAPLINKGTRGYYFSPGKGTSTSHIPAPEAVQESTVASQSPLQGPFTAAADKQLPKAANDQDPPPPAAKAPRNPAL